MIMASFATVASGEASMGQHFYRGLSSWLSKQIEKHR